MIVIRVASLFAGIGGICKGFEQAGAKIVWANELDKNACITYRANFVDNNREDYLVDGDIRKVDERTLPNFDILTAGFPCVAFSVAGRRQGMHYKCINCNHEHTVTFDEYINNQAYCPNCGGQSEPKDPRGTLFYDIVRVLRVKKPKAFLLENVKNLVGHDKGRTFKIMSEMLEAEGYHIKKKVLNTMEYANIPQNRERIFIIGFLNEVTFNKFDFPDKMPLTKRIDDIVNRSERKENKYYYTENSRYFEMMKDAITRKDTMYQLRRIYIRENQSGVCPTLTANMGGGGHNVPLLLDDFGIRKLTPWETLQFQGFPDDFVIPEGMADSHIYKQAGNAVSVPVVYRIALNIINALQEQNNDESEMNDRIVVTVE